MKTISLFTKNIFEYSNPKNFDFDYKNQTKYISCVLSSDLSNLELKKIAQNICKYINRNYFKGLLTIFVWNQEILTTFLNYFQKYRQFKNFTISVNSSRKSVISCLSKISEKKLLGVLLIVPTYDKILFKTYLHQLNFTDFEIYCVKTSLFKTLPKIYQNSKIIANL